MKRVVVLPWTCFFCAIVPDTSCWYPRWWPNCCRIVETQHSRCWWCHSHPLLDPRHWSSQASQVWKTQRKTVKWQFEAANQKCSFTMPFVCSIAQLKHAHFFSIFRGDMWNMQASSLVLAKPGKPFSMSQVLDKYAPLLVEQLEHEKLSTCE